MRRGVSYIIWQMYRINYTLCPSRLATRTSVSSSFRVSFLSALRHQPNVRFSLLYDIYVLLEASPHINETQHRVLYRADIICNRHCCETFAQMRRAWIILRYVCAVAALYFYLIIFILLSLFVRIKRKKNCFGYVFFFSWQHQCLTHPYTDDSKYIYFVNNILLLTKNTECGIWENTRS